MPQVHEAQEAAPQDAGSADTVCQAFQATVAAHGPRPAIQTRGGRQQLTWAGYGDAVRRTAGGLAWLGVSAGDTVAMRLTNRPEFHVADMAVLHLGAVPFSIYNTSPVPEIAHRLEVADATVVLTEQAFLDDVLRAAADCDGVRYVVVVDGDAPEGGYTLDEVQANAPADFDFEAGWRAVGPDDLAAITFTSGTTGPAKAAQWSHRGVARTVAALDAALPLPSNQVSYLPMAHAGERMFTHYMPLANGGQITCCPDPREVLVYVGEVRPDVVLTPPRMWDKLKIAIQGLVDQLDDDGQERMRRAQEIGAARARAASGGESFDPALAAEHDALKPWLRETFLAPFGLDRLDYAFIGAAPSKPATAEYYHALGLPLLEAYGLTECGACAVFNRPDDFRIGTVGQPLAGVELKLAPDGEILLRSPMNMVGYRKDAEATAQAIDADGWLATGDVGVIDADGYLSVVDRKKELIINASGKSMSPANIEAEVKSCSPVLGQVVAAGDGRPYNVALMTLDPDAVPVLAGRVGHDPQDLAGLVCHPDVVATVEQGVATANRALSGPEQVKRFRLLPVVWTPDSDELTPSMKLKRNTIMRKYARDVEDLYR